MSTLKKILLILLVVVIVITGLAIFALKSGVFTVEARNYVISLIKKNTGKDIKIGNIELGIFNNIVVHDVSMPVSATFAEKGEFASIKAVIIRFNLLDLLYKRKDINNTLSSIIIESPLIYVKKEKGSFNLTDFVSSFVMPTSNNQNGNVLLPVSKVLIEKGKIIYEDKDISFNSYVDDFSGEIMLKENPMFLRVTLSGRTKNSNKKNFMLDVDYYLGSSRYRGNIKISDAALNDWGAYFMQPKDFAINSGEFFVEAAVSGTGVTPEQMKIYGNGGIKNGSILIKNNISVTEINGNMEINSDKIALNKASFKVYGGIGIVEGAANDVFGNMNFKAKAEINGINLGEFNAQNLSGTAMIQMSVFGDRLKQQGDISLELPEGVVQNTSIKDINIRAVLKDNVIKLESIKGLLGSSSLNGGGTVDLNKGRQNYNLHISADGLDVKKITGNKEIDGNINLALQMQGSLDNPKIIGELKSVKIKYSGNDINNINASITAAGDAIALNGFMEYKNYKKLILTSIIDISKEKISINILKLQNGKDLLINAKGALLIKDGSLGITITAKDIMLSDLGLGFLKGKNIDGAIRGTVFIKGTKEKPESEMHLSIPELKIRDGIYKATASLKYAENIINLSDVNLNDNLRGSGEISLIKKIFDVNFDVKSLKGEIVSELLGTKLLDNGVINGKIFVKKEASGYGGNINLETTYSMGIYTGSKIDIAGSDNAFTINQFDIRQKKGMFKSSGSFSVKNDSDIKSVLNAKLDNYELNDKLEANAVIKYSLEAFLGDAQTPFTTLNTLKVTKIFFNGKAQSELEATLKTAGRNIPELKIKWGDGYGVQASVDASPEVPVVQANIQLKNADLFRIYTLLNYRDTPLDKGSLVSSELNISGPVNMAKVTGDMMQAKGTINYEGFVSLEKKKAIYFISSFDIKYKALNINLKNFANIFNDRFNETGMLNGNGNLKGSIDSIESVGNITLTTGKFASLPYDNIKADYVYKNKKITLNKGELNYKDSYLKLDGSSFEIKADNDYYATLLMQMKDLNVKTYKFNGNLNFYGRILNDKKLKITGSLGSDNFMFRKHRFGSFVLNVNFEDDTLVLKSSKGKYAINAELMFGKEALMFKKYTAIDPDGNTMLNVTGAVQMHKDMESNLLIAVKDTDPQMINDLLGWDHTWTGKANGNVKISGNVEKGMGITVYVVLSNGMVDGVDFDIVNGLVVIKDDAVNLSPIDNIVLTKADKYVISVGGRIPVPLTENSMEKIKGSEMSLSVKMKGGDLSVFKFLKFVDDASGLTDLDLVIKGTKEYPSVSGKLSITGGDIKLKYLFKDLKNVYANVLLKDNVIDIYTMKADTERGTIKVENLDDKKGGTMRLMKPYEVNWRITNTGDKIRFTDTAYLDFISGDADLDLAMTGLLDEPNIKGTMRFENARLVYPVKVRTKSGEQTDIKDNYAARINWNVSVTGGENVHYYNNYYNNFADLTLKFYNGQPIKFYDKGINMKIYGNVGVSKGTYKYMNTELQMDDMKQSKVTFDNDRRAILDIYAKAALKKFALNKNIGAQIVSKSETTDLNIYVRFVGRVGNVNLEMSSDPPLNRDRLLYILTVGKDQDKYLSPADALKYVDAIANSWLRTTVSSIVPADIIPNIDVKLQNIVPVATTQGVTRTVDDTTNIEVGIGRAIGNNWYLEYRPKLIDITNKFNIQHTLSGELSLDSTSKVVLEGIVKDRTIDPVNYIEGRASYKLNIPFDSWGAKPSPTPVKTPIK